MKKLTPKLAKSISKKYFRKYKDKEEQNFAEIHSSAVAEISIILAKKFKADISIVEMAGLVHDIGSTISRSNHAKHSLDLLEREDVEVNTLIKDCILNHGTNGEPKSIEAKILQMADKLSILSIPVLKILLRQKSISSDDIEFVNKMSQGAVDYLKKINPIN